MMIACYNCKKIREADKFPVGYHLKSLQKKTDVVISIPRGNFKSFANHHGLLVFRVAVVISRGQLQTRIVVMRYGVTWPECF